ncbi:hypothetical protein LSUE1_G007927 [Lachnellula suecica]|uniref:Uncharacterized protein n=1 Tax=Lachnellula suecica TaxID=602035 RepID=A0A8T9BZV3_9HELO|nr:hypothetical protein LSUE1_G007927 [Lachnellula suecica]
MSDYPATPFYGMGYGASDQNNPPYLPPTYPTQYLPQDDGRMGQAGMPSSYDASMSTHGYNGATPSFSASAIASGVPPLPIYQGWNSDPVPLPPYAPAQPVPQFSGYSNGPTQNSQYYSAPTQAPYQQSPQNSRPYDEGELSEGEFDGSTGPASANNGRAQSAYGAKQSRAHEGTNYVDNAQRSGYFGAQDHNSQPSYHPSTAYNFPARDSPQTRPQQSDVYSPYESPRPTGHTDQVKANYSYDSYAPSHPGGQMNGAPQNQNGWVQDSAASTSKVSWPTNGAQHPTNAELAKGEPVKASTPILPKADDIPSAKIIAEARKQAQNAILNLWPYEVRFQQYIDEGISEDIVGRLFDEIGMSRNPSKTANGNENKLDTQPTFTPNTSQEVNTTIAGSSSKVQLAPLSTLPNGQLPSTNGSTPGTSLTSQTANVPTAGAQLTGPTEKDKILQSKMDVLRKARAARAEKAAAQKSIKSPTDSPSSTRISLQQPTVASASVPNIASAVEKPALPAVEPQIPSLPLSSQPPTPAANNKQQGSMIPGLFLASAAASPVSSTSAQPFSQNSQRKRPVAADFDSPVPAPFKRPFGQSRTERPVVIDVSDEDSDNEDAPMDLESQADPESPVQSSRKLSDQRSTSLHNLPPLSDFPSQKHFTPPSNSSAPGTPNISQNVSKSAIGHPEVLRQKESQIEQMKKKIAEAEARKKARQTPSGTRTPRVAELQPVDTKAAAAVNADLASNVEASLKVQHLIEVADTKVASDQQKLAEAQAAELEKEAELKRNEAERKRLRRLEVAAGIPLVEAEVHQSQLRLEQARAEIARMEAEVQKNLKAKQDLAEEMERLGQETEDQLQAQKDKLQNLTTEEYVSNNAPSRSSPPKVAEQVALETKAPAANLYQPSPPIAAGHLQSDEPSKAVMMNGHGQFALPTRENPEDTTTSKDDAHAPIEQPDMAVPSGLTSSPERTSADQAMEEALQEAVRVEADSHDHGADDVDMETSFAPDPNQLAPASSSNSAEEERDSPMYSPVLGRTIPDVPEAESDNYEPPEATPPVNVPVSIDSSPFSPAPPDADKPNVVDDSLQVGGDDARSATEQLVQERNASIPHLIQVNMSSNLAFAAY